MRPQDIVAAGYDAMSQRYAEWQAEIAHDPRERYAEQLLALLPRQPSILEIGVGAGVEPTPTFNRVGHLTGIDISKAQVERARAALPGAELIHGDVTTTTFAPGSFDAVVALYVFTHVPPAALPGLLEQIAEWLRPGGLLLATFGTGPAHESTVDDFLGAPMYFSGFDEQTNERLIEQAGLSLVGSRVERIHEPESEPGRGPATAAFHWILARRS